jgi:hypothetical protein
VIISRLPKAEGTQIYAPLPALGVITGLIGGSIPMSFPQVKAKRAEGGHRGKKEVVVK